jgi:uncharacterized protein (TIGR01244 family)
MAVTDITGFLRVDERLATGGQPTEAQVKEIAGEGYAVVINLGLKDPRYCLADEAESVALAGMRYEHVPVKFDAPEAEDFHAFRAAMKQHEGKRVFVHCAANYRVTSFMALYGEAELGWSRQQADEWATRLWQPNETWARFLAERRRELFG